MCSWMGSHFHSWADYNGAAFSLELLKWDHTFSGIRGSENSGRLGFNNGKIFTSLRLTNVSIHFKMTQLKGFIKQMHKQKVTKITFSQKRLRWSLSFGHIIDYNGVRVLRDQRHIPSRNWPQYPPPHHHHHHQGTWTTLLGFWGCLTAMNSSTHL